MTIWTVLTGVLVIHIALAIAYVCGSFILTSKSDGPFQSAPAADIVVTIGVGISAI